MSFALRSHRIHIFIQKSRPKKFAIHTAIHTIRSIEAASHSCGNTIARGWSKARWMLSPDRQRKRKWVRIQRAMASREGIPPVRRPAVLAWSGPFSTFVLRWPTAEWRSPNESKTHHGESFRNRIAIDGGPENSVRGPVHRREWAWESRLRKRNCFARREVHWPVTFLQLSPSSYAKSEVKSRDFNDRRILNYRFFFKLFLSSFEPLFILEIDWISCE